MSKNTVTRVSAPDTTERTKKRNTEIAAKAAAEERERKRTYIGAPTPEQKEARRLAESEEYFRTHQIRPVEYVNPDETAGTRYVKAKIRGDYKGNRLQEFNDLVGVVGEMGAGFKAGGGPRPVSVKPGGMNLFYAVSGASKKAALDTIRSSKELQGVAVAVRSGNGVRVAMPPEGPYSGGGVTYVLPKEIITAGGDRRVAYYPSDSMTASRRDVLEYAKKVYKESTGKDVTDDAFLLPRKQRTSEVNTAIDKAFEAVFNRDVQKNFGTTDEYVAKKYRSELSKSVDAYLAQTTVPEEYKVRLAGAYNEAKINSEVPLRDVKVLIDMDRIDRFSEKLRAFGIKIPVIDPESVASEFENNGIRVIRHGGKTERSFLDALEEANAFFTDEVQQDAKGGQAADVRAATKGGDGGNETAQVDAPVQGTAAQVSDGGPRIVINPSTFHNEKDALCVAYNEALRIVMEENGFDPVSEPTDAQREFFADTAYADDELMLRRTILARICVFDTSVKDPTDEQLEEAVEFLETVMEIGAPQNSEEQSVIQRAHDIILKILQGSRQGQGAREAEGPQGQTEEPREPGNPSASVSSKESQSEPQPPESPSEGSLQGPPM